MANDDETAVACEWRIPAAHEILARLPVVRITSLLAPPLTGK
jgi:hypothetical protein